MGLTKRLLHGILRPAWDKFSRGVSALVEATDITINAKTYLGYLQSLEFVDKVIPLNGGLASSYDKSKVPTDQWKDKRHTDEELLAHAQKGGWWGLVLKQGYVAVDIDDPEFAKRLNPLYNNVFHTYTIETRKGIHLVFRVRDFQKANLNQYPLSGVGDFRVGGSGYIVAPTRFGDEQVLDEKWGKRRVLSGEQVKPLPVLFHPVWKAQSISPPKVGERNNLLYRVGRACRGTLLRAYGGQVDRIYDELRLCLEAMNSFCDAPLPASEFENLVQHVYMQEDKEEYQPFRKNGHAAANRWDSAYDEEEEGALTEQELSENNPFFELVSLEEAVAKEGGLQPYFWDGVCRFGDVVLVVAPPKSGKSTFVRSLALSLGGHPFLDPSLPKKDVVWFAFEERANHVYNEFEKAKRFGGANHIRFAFVNPTFPHAFQKLVYAIRRVVEEQPDVGMIVVDTIGRVMSDVDINDYTSVQRMIEELRFALRGVANPPVLVLVHHTNKSVENRSPLGSQAFSATVDVVVTLEADGESGGVNISIAGRGVSPAFYQKKLSLRYDSAGVVTGIGASVAPAVSSLLRHLLEHGAIPLRRAKEWAGGSVRLDVMRLIRQGYLLVVDGAVRINHSRSGLERLLSDEPLVLTSPEPNNTAGEPSDPLDKNTEPVVNIESVAYNTLGDQEETQQDREEHAEVIDQKLSEALFTSQPPFPIIDWEEAVKAAGTDELAVPPDYVSAWDYDGRDWIFASEVFSGSDWVDPFTDGSTFAQRIGQRIEDGENWYDILSGSENGDELSTIEVLNILHAVTKNVRYYTVSPKGTGHRYLAVPAPTKDGERWVLVYYDQDADRSLLDRFVDYIIDRFKRGEEDQIVSPFRKVRFNEEIVDDVGYLFVKKHTDDGVLYVTLPYRLDLKKPSNRFRYHVLLREALDERLNNLEAVATGGQT